LDNPIQGFRTGPNLVRWALLCNFVVSLGALTAILVLATGFSDFVVPLAAFPLVFPVLYYVTHTSLRYRHPVDPVLILLTALTLRWFWEAYPRITGMDR
jgi:ABC-type transport system involved in cytochrome c biogenesis permease component